MKNFLAVLVAFCPAIAMAWPSLVAHSAQPTHPAVVRIIAAEQNGASSLGTGALVAVDEAHGLVVTNWHVVRDATGPITVVFSDGFRSGARLLKTDRDWDLAALAIQRPQVQPLPLATEPPRPGEPLSIAGYGPEGAYLAVTGRCVKYHTPGGNLPHEIIEVDVEARRGDSGGPICNSRGEIAGILFGAAGNTWSGGYTMGSYCGRVRQFLAAAYLDFQRLPSNTAMVAQAPAPQPPPPMTAITTTLPPLVENHAPTYPSGGAVAGSTLQPAAKTGPFGAMPAADGKIAANRPSPPALVPSPSGSPMAQVLPATVAPQTEPLPSRTDQIKTILAVIGVIAILFHALRLAGSSVG
ncbi:MAG: serine protease [Planctomycetota bacterium]